MGGLGTYSIAEGKALEADIREAENRGLERAAQLGDERAEFHTKYPAGICRRCRASEARDIAAAIRAMKEET